jgi:hypothetical protein
MRSRSLRHIPDQRPHQIVVHQDLARVSRSARQKSAGGDAGICVCRVGLGVLIGVDAMGTRQNLGCANVASFSYLSKRLRSAEGATSWNHRIRVRKISVSRKLEVRNTGSADSTVGIPPGSSELPQRCFSKVSQPCFRAINRYEALRCSRLAAAQDRML